MEAAVNNGEKCNNVNFLLCSTTSIDGVQFFFFFLQKDKQVLTLEYFHCYGFLILEKWFTTLEAHWNHLRALRNSHA